MARASYFESRQEQNCPESCGETEHNHLNNKIDQQPISSAAIILIFQFFKTFFGQAIWAENCSAFESD